MTPANDLRQIFRGVVDEPDEGLIVAEPLSSLDVRAAVIAAGVHELPLAVYATGHGTLDFRLHPVSSVYGGIGYFPIERAAETLARFRDWTDQPEELMISVVLIASAPEGIGVDGPVLAIRGVYAGDARAGARALRPLLDAAGTPLAPRFREMPFAETGTIGGTAPLAFERFADLPDALIEAAVALVDGAAEAVEVRRWGGATARSGGPVGHRDVPFSMTIEGDAGAVRPYATGGTFLNFLRDPARLSDAFDPADYERLRQIKRAYDPENLFGAGHTVAPSELAAAA